jgi:periplasmic copper chaperone A
MSLLKRSALVAATVGGLTLALAAPAAAHVTVNPNTATPGGYTKVTFRVPNEKDNAATTKLEVNLPADKPVASVSVKPVPGWTAVAEKSKLATPIKAHDTEITEAVSKITWTADANSAIKPGQFQEFDVSLGPLPDNGQMVFKALQTYSDGDIVRWIDEPTTDGTEPEHPAPVLKLAAATVAAPDSAATTTSSSSNGSAFGIAGLVAGLLALVLALLAFQRATRKPNEASDPVSASTSTSTSASEKVPAAKS